NGSTLDDDAIDRAITAANAAGGGVVLVPKGTYKSRTIHLKSNITLQLDSGATIKAASSGMDAAEPNSFSQYQDYGHSHFHNALLDGVQVLATKSRDGVNLINTANVEVTHSRIEAQDDALSFKSDFALGRTFASEHISVHDSTILSTENNALQFGVESCGDF